MDATITLHDAVLTPAPAKYAAGQTVLYLDDHGAARRGVIRGVVRAMIGTYYLIGWSAETVCESKILEVIEA